MDGCSSKIIHQINNTNIHLFILTIDDDSQFFIMLIDDAGTQKATKSTELKTAVFPLL